MASGQLPLLQPKLKRGKASLIGGIGVGLCVLVLWFAGMHELGASGIGAGVVGLLLSGGIAAWVRLADL